MRRYFHLHNEQQAWPTILHDISEYLFPSKCLLASLTICEIYGIFFLRCPVEFVFCALILPLLYLAVIAGAQHTSKL